MKIVLLILLSLLPCMAWTQVKNVSTEVKDYREIDGKIILDMAVNGEIASFVLDLAGHTAILSEYLDSLNIDSNSQVPSRNKTFLYKQVPVSTSVMINTILQTFISNLTNKTGYCSVKVNMRKQKKATFTDDLSFSI